MSEQDRFRRFSEGLPSRRGLVIVSCPKCQKKLEEYETKVTRLTEHAYERIDLGRDAPGLVAFEVKVCDPCMEKLRKNPKARPGQKDIDVLELLALYDKYTAKKNPVKNPRYRGNEDWGDDPDTELFHKIRRMVAQYYPEAADLPETPWAAQLLAEACNWLAKRNEIWYHWKPIAWSLARRMGAKGGWSPDRTHNLYTPEAGVSSAHDPWGQLAALLPGEGDWPFRWSGIRRQNQAELLIQDRLRRRIMAESTAPDPLRVLPWAGEHPSRTRQRAGIRATKVNPGKKKLHKKRSLDTLALVARKGAGSGYHKSRPAREKRLPRKMKHKKPAETES
jgi:hypothetical protein